ncbi:MULTISPECIES: proton-conducting membrane transporter [unclassified Mesorhizobium]|uniref:proton-conducting membrane transporter n=1 Tax=unclassified Mesorhizobium TaxID=325217 RepID=UPI000BAFDB00|nr:MULTISPECIES: proton-conducting membrane transporter [unclassified Mesorhizobium]AZO11644.1 proton-conducting membrane transporter [Mesorhizobium sp. M3A.F.Ca.ET.080.04.2.1]PBB86737.1 proton-conducting membrane transporter [Mesorhizobium sp. WSM3876]RWB72720.1 MAG: proton-conducting membrane transporter [Mesorhizobium sp.]RWE22922.1 MAG: proton-conducting membrane transporter [Mesorhizobium sp.]RWE29424.1 MAG: proton-conducting membrane transporter [Mesorhizobium sp.]
MSTFFYMLLAFVAGVLLGWFIWGRLRSDLDSLRADLDRTRGDRDRMRADADRLAGELDACVRARDDIERQLREAPTKPAGVGADKASAPAPSALISTPAAAQPSTPRSKPARKPAAPTAAAPPKKAAVAPKKSAALNAAGGKADELRRLIGIGPVNERLLREQGVTTYAQIAAWSEDDVKRIEEVLSFDGRIAREKWVEQAKLLAAGDEAEFARLFPSAGTASNS